MTLGNNFDFVRFDGDLDGASNEASFRYTFQSVFPFKRDDGSSVFFRPAIPVFFGEPVPRAGDGSINITSLNYVYAIQLGGGWQFASAPAITYNHDAEDGQEWTVPLGVGIARTTVIKGRPWKFQLQYWNYVERGDVFAPEQQFRISISPVVSAPWNE